MWNLEPPPSPRRSAGASVPDSACPAEISGYEDLQDAFPETSLTSPTGDYLLLRHPLGDGAVRDPELGRLAEPVLMLDLETLGFLGRPLFLIGVFRPTETGAWEVAQFLARDYAEEEAVLQAFVDCARELPVWVSFNGKSFDVPVLRNRAAFYGIRIPAPVEHHDLLHKARRTYKGVLPNCRLKTLESRIFGRVRYRDLDGWSIPAAYHDFVRTRRSDEMIRILRHNRDDLATLARLHVHLRDPAEQPDSPILHPEVNRVPGS